MPADKFTFGAMVLQNELKNVIAATIAMAIVVLMLWVFFFLRSGPDLWRAPRPCCRGPRGGGGLGALVVTELSSPSERGSRSGFFNFQSLRTLPRIAARKSHDHQSEMTTNPTTHRLRATVKKTIRNAILKI